MTYPTISSKSADRLIYERKADAETQIDKYVVYRESVESFGDINAKSALNAVEEIRATYPTAIAPKSRYASNFEAQVAPVIHSQIGSGEYCADPEFWMWLSALYFFQITQWRYGEDLKVANLGIGAPTENFIYRLWLRAELMQDHSQADPYELARRGSSVDFWRSHIFRPAYSNSRAFARALVRFQYRAPAADATLTVALVRQLAKRLTQLRSNQIFACLNEEEAYSLISNEAHAITNAS